MHTGLAPSVLKSVEFLEGIRKDVAERLAPLSEEEALRVPAGSRNSVHWNVGHILHVHLAHWYTRRGQPMPVDYGWKVYFREGKSPADYDAGTPGWSLLLSLYREYSTGLAEKFRDLLGQPLSAPFTYLGTRFETIDDDLRLLIFHEGEHYVIVKRLLRAIGRG
jgi:uncharacterized damage-inducible protein DinB